MQVYGRRLLLRDTSRSVDHVFRRQVSLTGAINRGIRKTQRSVETAFEGVRNNRSDDARESTPWHSRNERTSERRENRDRGWQGDVKQRLSSRDNNSFGGSDLVPRRSYHRDNRDGYSGSRGGGGFNRDNADRRVRYEGRKDGSRPRGPPPNLDGPNRAERRKVMFGEPYSGKPQYDSSFMDGHMARDVETRESKPSGTSRSIRYEKTEDEGDDDFEEDYTDPESGGWKADDVEKEWSVRKAQFQPEFTRARDIERMNREERYSRPRNNGDINDRQNSLGLPQHYNRDNQAHNGRGPPREGFRKSQPRGDHFIPREDQEASSRQRTPDEDLEDFDDDFEMPSLEQRRNKFRPARKLERSVVDIETFSKISVTAPASVPFTTSASTFLWGTFSVQEAIRAGRRTLYTLYIYRGQSIDAPTTPESYHLISKLALSRGCNIKEISGEGWSRLLNKMTASRPHNGWVLEASEIPKLPVTSLLPMQNPQNTFQVNLGHQSAEDLAINAPVMEPGSSPNTGIASIPSLGQQSRFPLILLLDRIMDPGNLGAIVRSAHFLGVDALLVLEHSTAPFNAIMLKVAAGAAEYLPILMARNEHDLVKASKKNGWRFFAAVGLDAASGSGVASQGADDLSTALGKGPCVLMLGSEGEGLRPHLQKLADGVASIRNARGENAGVDSLNVSVASALLCQEFLRGPHQVVAPKENELERFDPAPDSSINQSITQLGGEETEAEMVERQEEKVF